MRGTAALLLGAALVATASPALAAEGDPVTGYWARTTTGLPLPAQPPDPTPEGGMWIAADPSGPLAVSALRTELAPGLVAVELRLAVADAVGVPAVQACPSIDRWAPDRGGRLDGAPAADCSAALPAAVNGDRLVVKLPTGVDAVNVLLRPAPGSAFSLTLERPSAESVVTTQQPAAPYAPAPAPPPFQPAGPAYESAALPPLTPAGAAPAPLLGAPAPRVAQPAPVPQAAPAPVALAPRRPRAATPPDDRGESLLAVVILVLLAGQAVRLAQQPAVAPQRLGGAARHGRSEPVQPAAATAARPRGVGRFRTVRQGPPVRI